MRANASSVSTSPSVARIAASESAFAASVPPIPPTSDVLQLDTTPRSAPQRVGEPVRGRRHAAGDRLADREHVRLQAVRGACTRPGPQQIVCVSSITSSVPVRRVSSRAAPSWKPCSGWTIPMFVSAGSASTHATSPGASAASSASTSFHSTTSSSSRRVDRRAEVAPRASARPPSSSVANVSSTVPW